MKRRSILTSVCLIVYCIVFLGGCTVVYDGNPEPHSTSCGNITMGNGKFSYDNGFVYYTDLSDIYEYEIASNKAVTVFSTADIIKDIYVQDQYIYFNSNGLKRVTKDGKKQQRIFERNDGCLQLFVEDANAWYLDSVEGTLYRRDLKTKKEEAVLSHVMSYYVDDEHIYAIAKEEDVPALFISDKNNIQFNKVTLSFLPINVLADDGIVYMAERESYQVVQWDSGKESRLPIASCYYQIMGNRIIYLDSSAYDNSNSSLMQYDMTTGEKKRISEDVSDFNLLEDRYICIQCRAEDQQFWIYDAETGKMENMNTEGVTE